MNLEKLSELRKHNNRLSAKSMKQRMKERSRGKKAAMAFLHDNATVAIDQLWFGLSAQLSIKPSQAAEFVELLLRATPGLELYSENDLGLYSVVTEDDEFDVRSVLMDVWQEASSCDWNPHDCAEWEFLRVANSTADIIRQEAARILGASEGAGRVSLNVQSQWPWGGHETKLLCDLAAAAKKWWANFDPDDNTTAPTNEDVSAWLMSECKTTERMAKAIATILRADGLPTGPRTSS